MAVDESGYVWVGLHDGRGVSLLNHEGSLDNRDNDTWITFTEAAGLPKGHTWVEDIAIDSQGRLWFGHSLGATLLDHKGTPFFKEDDTWVDFSDATVGLSYRFVNVIFEDSQGCMWFGGDSGVSRDCGALPVILNVPSCTNYCWSVQWLGYVWDIDQDQNGNIWIADGSCGAAKLTGNQWSLCDTTHPDCPILSDNDGSDDGVRSVEVDPNNSVWFGTRGKDVARLNGFDD